MQEKKYYWKMSEDDFFNEDNFTTIPVNGNEDENTLAAKAATKIVDEEDLYHGDEIYVTDKLPFTFQIVEKKYVERI